LESTAEAESAAAAAEDKKRAGKEPMGRGAVLSIILLLVVPVLRVLSTSIPIFSHHNHKPDPTVPAVAAVSVEGAGSGSDAAAAHSAATLSCAIIVVGGPTGISFESEEHVERFLQKAQGCRVFVTAQPHFQSRAMRLSGDRPEQVHTEHWTSVVQRAEDGKALPGQPPQWLARTSVLLHDKAVVLWKAVDLVICTHSDVEVGTQYLAAMKDVHDHPKRLFVLGEGLFYSTGKLFTELFRHANSWVGFPPTKKVSMLPSSGVSHELFSNFLRQSPIFQRSCDLRDDLDMDVPASPAARRRLLVAKENGHCHYSTTLAPVTVAQTRDLWWQESKWVFAFGTGLQGIEGFSNSWIYNSLIAKEASRPGSRIARFIQSQRQRTELPDQVQGDTRLRGRKLLDAPVDQFSEPQRPMLCGTHTERQGRRVIDIALFFPPSVESHFEPRASRRGRRLGQVRVDVPAVDDVQRQPRHEAAVPPPGAVSGVRVPHEEELQQRVGLQSSARVSGLW
jgi:hypothetical protein